VHRIYVAEWTCVAANAEAFNDFQLDLTFSLDDHSFDGEYSDRTDNTQYATMGGEKGGKLVWHNAIRWIGHNHAQLISNDIIA
jgi:hypothetical protein